MKLANSLIVIGNDMNNNESNIGSVWIFNGVNSRFASGVFVDIEVAEAWISKNRLTGVLTNYPINKSVYDWATENGFFSPEKEEQKSSEFIGKFSSASQDHFHYEDGKRD